MKVAVDGARRALSKVDAQRRADRVNAFTQELAELERAGVLALTPNQRAGVERHHRALLSSLALEFDVNRTEPQRQMAIGMQIAALLAAVALSAAAVLFFYRVWGLLATPAQVAVLAATPLLLLVGVEVAVRREPTGYVASVLAIIASAGFALDLNALGLVFNMTPTPLVLAAWAAFALTVAYAYGLRLLLAGGIGAALGFVLAVVASMAGADWTACIARPEPLLVLGPCAVLVSFTRFATRREGFAAVWRLVGSTAFLLPLVFLSIWPEIFSYRLLRPGALHAIYDLAGFLAPVALVAWAISRRWRETVNLGAGFLVLFAYAKFFDWWWSVLPRYVFFLVLGGLAIVTLVVLARLRRRLKEV